MSTHSPVSLFMENVNRSLLIPHRVPSAPQDTSFIFSLPTTTHSWPFHLATFDPFFFFLGQALLTDVRCVCVCVRSNKNRERWHRTLMVGISVVVYDTPYVFLAANCQMRKREWGWGFSPGALVAVPLECLAISVYAPNSAILRGKIKNRLCVCVCV